MPFREVVGHRRLVRLVARSVRRGTLPPSLLFTGPAGVGKRLVAIAAAQALNCVQPLVTDPSPADPPLEIDACGACPACSKIARGVHPDVPIVEPGESGAIKVDQVRAVIESAGYRPFEGRRRVVVVDEADALVPHAQNALLKSLEEPPPSSMFLLITARPDALLPTVLSRCPRLRFKALDGDEVAGALVGLGWQKAEARATAAVAGGSVGRALAASGAELVQARAAAVDVLVRAAATSDASRRLESARELLPRTTAGGVRDRDHLAVHLRAMASLLRDAEVRGAGGPVPLANPDVGADVERLAAFRGDRGVRAFAAVDQALAALDRNAGVKVVADWIVLQL